MPLKTHILNKTLIKTPNTQILDSPIKYFYILPSSHIFISTSSYLKTSLNLVPLFVTITFVLICKIGDVLCLFFDVSLTNRLKIPLHHCLRHLLNDTILYFFLLDNIASKWISGGARGYGCLLSFNLRTQ